MEGENNFYQLGFAFSNLGRQIRRSSNDLADVANFHDEIMTELRALNRNVEAIQTRLDGVELNMSIRLTNSHNVLGTSVIEYINVINFHYSAKLK
jgi:hypothetical protein